MRFFFMAELPRILILRVRVRVFFFGKRRGVVAVRRGKETEEENGKLPFDCLGTKKRREGRKGKKGVALLLLLVF